MPKDDVGVKAIDEYTLEVTSEILLRTLRKHLPYLLPVRQDIMKRSEFMVQKLVVSNGPYT